MTTPYQGGPAPTATPVCPRHPDRVSFIRCQRCGRPVCVECQRPAAVGVHCVDCVHQAARTTPQPRTAFGAPIRRGRPVVTLTLIGLTVASYLLQQVVGTPWTIALLLAPGAGETEPWRFLTAGFLHATSGYLALSHIAFNMYALWLLGRELEMALGRARFLALYLVAIIGGNVMLTLLAGPADWWQGAVGASGGVFGLFGALLVVLRRLGHSARPIIGLIVINGIIGFVIPNIAWEAHLGGLLVGFALGTAFAYAPKQQRSLVGIAAPALVLVILVVLAVAKYTLF